MPFVIAIIVIGVIIAIVVAVKNSNGSSQSTATANVYHPTVGVNQIPPDALINSRWYGQYKTNFDLIWYYHKQKKPQEQYKIDWLLESLENGLELEDNCYYVMDSMEEDLPYYCDAEMEYDYLRDKEKSVLLGNVDGMLDMIFYYHYMHKHASKLHYWLNKVIEMADSGNHYAQAAAVDFFRIPNAFDEQQKAMFKSRYEERVRNAAKSGNLDAQLAIIKYWGAPEGVDRTSAIRDIAQKGNLSNAWYQLSVEYFMKAYSTTNPPTEEEKKLYEDYRWTCFTYGASANNGVMAGYCQYMAGLHVEDDDPQTAKRWYEMAASNGLDMKYNLEYVNKQLGL